MTSEIDRAWEEGIAIFGTSMEKRCMATNGSTALDNSASSWALSQFCSSRRSCVRARAPMRHWIASLAASIVAAERNVCVAMACTIVSVFFTL